MTQLESSRKGILTPEIESVALEEKVNPHDLLASIARGETVIPANTQRKNRHAYGIGPSLRVKVNANVGTSPHNICVATESDKARAAFEAGADAIMDLSIAGDLTATRASLMAATPLPFGTVPMYEEMAQSKGNLEEATGDMMLSVIESQAKQGVDFMTIHCGITLEALPFIDERLMGVVSRGGSFLARWMRHHKKENPLFERFDEICEIARKYDVTISLGDSLRPGALADAGDKAQLSEISHLGDAVLRSRELGAQVIVEGPGHVPLHLIKDQVALMMNSCHRAPLYLLGPLVTDRAAGHDHIAAAIGGAIAGSEGVSFICYVTPAEHLRLPDCADVREGVIAARIAGHAADIAKGTAGAREDNARYSAYRRAFDWDGMYREAIDPVKARAYRQQSTHADKAVCSMCGEFCAMKESEA